MPPTKPTKPKAPKQECPHCGREIAVTHMKRHQGTWACYERRLARDLTSKLQKVVAEDDGPLPDDYVPARYDAAATVQLAYALGEESRLRPHYEVYDTQVIASIAAPEWLVRGAETLKRYRHKPSVVRDVTVVCRYLVERQDSCALEGFVVALALIKEDDDLSWGQANEAARDLFRETASKVISEDPEFALDAMDRPL